MKTATAKKHLTELHAEITGWKNESKLMRDELKAFQLQLTEILAKNTHVTVTAEGEHFQNQFIRHNEVADELLHELNSADHLIAEKAKGNSSADHILMDDHVELRDKMETQARLFAALKTEYKQFLAKWL